MTGVNITHVPYKGTPPAVNDLIGGRVQMMMALSPVAMPHVKSGKLRPLAVSGAKRVAELPDRPTVAETVPGYEATTWYGVLVPRGTPKPVIELLNQEIVKALGDKLVTERLTALGFETDTRSPQEFARFMQNETEKWAKVIAAAGIPKS
jgi:tripartite-type tricarboxylate transporter receptor subunit TctC